MHNFLMLLVEGLGIPVSPSCRTEILVLGEERHSDITHGHVIRPRKMSSCPLFATAPYTFLKTLSHLTSTAAQLFVSGYE